MVEGGGKYDKPSTHFLSDAVYVKRINNEEIIATHEHVNFTQTHTYAHDAQTCGYFTHHARVSRGDKKEFAHVLYDTTRDKHTHTHTHTRRRQEWIVPMLAGQLWGTVHTMKGTCRKLDKRGKKWVRLPINEPGGGNRTRMIPRRFGLDRGTRFSSEVGDGEDVHSQ